MTFQNLHSDIECDCLDNTKEDFQSEYGLKTNKEKLRPVDFESHWEKNKRPENNTCEEVCSYKGKSVSLIEEGKLEEVRQIFAELFPLAPGYKPFLSVVKFADNTGKVKHTPDHRNQYHHDFYKCDNFTFENIVHIQSIPLADNV